MTGLVGIFLMLVLYGCDAQVILDVSAVDCTFTTFYPEFITSGVIDTLYCSMTASDDATKTTTIVVTTDETSTVTADPGLEVTLARGGTETILITVSDTSDITFSVIVHRPYSDDATLSSMTLDAACDGFSFDSTKLEYSCTVEPNITQVMVTCEANSVLASVVTTYSPSSGEVDFTPSITTVQCQVTPEASEDSLIKQYIISISRRLDDVANIRSFTTDGGCETTELTPEGLPYYQCEVDNDKDVLGLTIDKQSPYSSVAITGSSSLLVGHNLISVLVTSQDLSNTDEFFIFLIRNVAADEMQNSMLRSLELGCTLTERVYMDILSYTCVETLANDIRTVEAFTVDAVTLDDGSAVSYGGDTFFNIGSNVLDIIVTSEDGSSSTTYQVSLDRAASDDATLSALTGDYCDFSTMLAEWVDPGFGEVYEMTCTVAYDVESLSVSVVTTDDEATTYLDGAGNWALNFGTNTKTIVIVASDGFTDTSWTLVVDREYVSTNALLNDLSIPECVLLEPAFDPMVNQYTCVVLSESSSLTPVVTTDGTQTTAIDTPSTLIFGTNFMSVTVTAQDGIETSTYSVTVVRTSVAGDAVEDNSFSVYDLNVLTLTFPSQTLDFTSTDELVTFSTALVLELDEQATNFIGRFAVSALLEQDGVTASLAILESGDVSAPTPEQLETQFFSWVTSLQNGTRVLEVEQFPVLSSFDENAVSNSVAMSVTLYECPLDGAHVGFEECYMHSYEFDLTQSSGSSSSTQWYQDLYVQIAMGGGLLLLILGIALSHCCYTRNLCPCCGESLKKAGEFDDDFDDAIGLESMTSTVQLDSGADSAA